MRGLEPGPLGSRRCRPTQADSLKRVCTTFIAPSRVWAMGGPNAAFPARPVRVFPVCSRGRRLAGRRARPNASYAHSRPSLVSSSTSKKCLLVSVPALRCVVQGAAVACVRFRITCYTSSSCCRRAMGDVG